MSFKTTLFSILSLLFHNIFELFFLKHTTKQPKIIYDLFKKTYNRKLLPKQVLFSLSQNLDKRKLILMQHTKKNTDSIVKQALT